MSLEPNAPGGNNATEESRRGLRIVISSALLIAFVLGTWIWKSPRHEFPGTLLANIENALADARRATPVKYPLPKFSETSGDSDRWKVLGRSYELAYLLDSQTFPHEDGRGILAWSLEISDREEPTPVPHRSTLTLLYLDCGEKLSRVDAKAYFSGPNGSGRIMKHDEFSGSKLRTAPENTPAHAAMTKVCM